MALAGMYGQPPHAVLGMELSAPEALAFNVTVLRAARRHRATEVTADMQRVEASDEMGISRVLTLLLHGYVNG